MHKKSRSKKGPKHPPQDNVSKAGQVKTEPVPSPLTETVEKKDDQRVPDPSPQKPQTEVIQPETITHESNISEIPPKPKRHKGGRKKKQTGDNRCQHSEVDDQHTESSSERTIQKETLSDKPQIPIPIAQTSTILPLQKEETVICENLKPCQIDKKISSATIEQNKESEPAKLEKVPDKKKKLTGGNEKQPSAIGDQNAILISTVSNSEKVVQKKCIAFEPQNIIPNLDYSSTSVDTFIDNLKACQIDKCSQMGTSEKNKNIQPIEIPSISEKKKNQTVDNKKHPSALEAQNSKRSSEKIIPKDNIYVQPQTEIGNNPSTIMDIVKSEHFEPYDKSRLERTMQSNEAQAEKINEKKKKQTGDNKIQSSKLEDSKKNIQKERISVESQDPVLVNDISLTTIEKYDADICENLQPSQITTESESDTTVQNTEIQHIQKQNVREKNKKQKKDNKKQFSTLEDHNIGNSSNKVIKKESLPVKTQVLNPITDNSSAILSRPQIDTEMNDSLNPCQIDNEAKNATLEDVDIKPSNIQTVPDTKKQIEGIICHYSTVEDETTSKSSCNIVSNASLPCVPHVSIALGEKKSIQKIDATETTNLLPITNDNKTQSGFAETTRDFEAPIKPEADSNIKNEVDTMSKVSVSTSLVSECKLEQIKSVNILNEPKSTSLDSFTKTTAQLKTDDENNKISDDVSKTSSIINLTDAVTSTETINFEILKPLCDVKNESKSKGKGKNTKGKHITENIKQESTSQNKESLFTDKCKLSYKTGNMTSLTEKNEMKQFSANLIPNPLLIHKENQTILKNNDTLLKIYNDNVQSINLEPDKLNTSVQPDCSSQTSSVENVKQYVADSITNLVSHTNISNTTAEVKESKVYMGQYETVIQNQSIINASEVEPSSNISLKLEETSHSSQTTKSIDTDFEKNKPELPKKKGKGKKHPLQKQDNEHLTPSKGQSIIINQDATSSNYNKSIKIHDDTKQFLTITLPQIKETTVAETHSTADFTSDRFEILVKQKELDSADSTGKNKIVTNLRENVTLSDSTAGDLLLLSDYNSAEKKYSNNLESEMTDSNPEMPALVSNDSLIKDCSLELINKPIQLKEHISLHSDDASQVPKPGLTIAEEIAESIKEELKCQLALISGSKNELYEKRIDDIRVETEKNVVKNIESIMKTVEHLVPIDTSVKASEIQECLPTSSYKIEKSDLIDKSDTDQQNNKQQQKGKGKSKKCNKKENDPNTMMQHTLTSQGSSQVATISTSQTASQSSSSEQATSNTTKSEKQNTKYESDQHKQTDSNPNDEKSKQNTETNDSSEIQSMCESNDALKDIRCVYIGDNNGDFKPANVNNKIDEFECIRSETFSASEKQYDDDSKTPDNDKDGEKKATLTRPKNLIGHPNIPVSSHKVDYKKEKNKSDETPSADNANRVNLLHECNQNSPEEYPKNGNKAIEIKSNKTDFENPPKHLFSTNCVKGKQTRKTNDLNSDDEEEFVYKYNFRNVFLPNACHFCKVLIVELKTICEFCGLIAYCNQNHRDSDWPQHQSLCYAVTTIMQINGLKHLYCKAGSLNGHEYRIYRMQMIVLCEKILKRKLLPSEQETLLYPRLCHDQGCREWQNNKLADCDKCGQVSYCKDNPHHVSVDHADWCTSYKIYHKLVAHQLNKGKIEPILPNRILPLGYTIPDKSSILMEELYNGNIDMDDCSFSTLSQLSTAPLTALYSYQLWKRSCDADNLSTVNLLIPTKFTIHIVGAEIQFEVDTLNKWEVFFMHLCPQLEQLNLVFIGPELNTTKLPLDLLKRIRLCKFCRQTSKNINIQFYDGVLYHDYVNGADFTKPDLVCAFNPGLHRTTGYAGQDTWPETIRSIFKVAAPFCVTSYTKQELPRDLMRISNCTSGHIQNHVLPRINPYASHRPDRNFLSDDEMPLIFKNYYFMVLSGQPS